jgi:hypothetical protein
MGINFKKLKQNWEANVQKQREREAQREQRRLQQIAIRTERAKAIGGLMSERAKIAQKQAQIRRASASSGYGGSVFGYAPTKKRGTTKKKAKPKPRKSLSPKLRLSPKPRKSLSQEWEDLTKPF